MSALLKIDPEADDIRQFFPDICQQSYEARARLRSARNCATFALLSVATGGVADALLAVLERHAASWMYAPAPLEELTKAVETAQAIYRAVQAAQKLEGAA